MLYDEKNFGDKKSNGHKGFYLAMSTALVCLLAAGVVYYKMDDLSGNGNDSNQLASEAVSSALPGVESSTKPAGNGALNKNGQQSTDKKMADASSEETEKTKSDSAKLADDMKTADGKTDQKKTKSPEKKEKASEEKTVAAMNNTNASQSFNEEEGLLWPVHGDILLKYSMDNTVYFKTLAQYRCNPAIEISCKNGEKVVSAATGTVTDISKDSEVGTTITMDIGSGYKVTYGQLKAVKVKEGQTVREGQAIAKVAATTKFFAQEGDNLYFQVQENSKAVDPLLLLR